jgi:hypothetical protein
MEKIILENRSDLSFDIFMYLVFDIIKEGKISNKGKQYCFMTTYDFLGKKYKIISQINKKSNKLILMNI